MSSFIIPSWAVQSRVKALITTVDSPTSNSNPSPIYKGFNLAKHVGEEEQRVDQNRYILKEAAKLRSDPLWLTQVHGIEVSTPQNKIQQADAAYTNKIDDVCVVMTADCLPLLLASEDGQEIAAVHAGWRGLLDGVIESALSQFASNNILAYLGPAISQPNFQVGPEVYQAFTEIDPAAKSAFIKDANEEDKYRMDIYLLAKQRLEFCGVKNISCGDYCTYADKRFYSYRRACHEGDGRTGRMASLIWISD